MSHNAQKNDNNISEFTSARYASSIGWDPNASKPDYTERERAALAKRARDEYRTRRALQAAIEIKTADEWLLEAAPLHKRKADLFPPFWREGEFVVLTGPPAAGRSALAVQIAETLASSSPSVDRPATLAAPQPVLLIDLQHNGRQIAERYSAGRKKHRFSKRFGRGLLADVEMPPSYKVRERFLRDAILETLAKTTARIVIIDDLSWLLRSRSSTELRGIIKTFRSWVDATGNSLLLLAQDPHQTSRRSPSTFHRDLSAFCDRVLTLSYSTFAPDYRYLKTICPNSRPSSPAPDHSSLNSDVHVYKLTRSVSPPSLTTAGLPAGASPTGVTTPSTAPFLGLEYLGLSPEEEHLKDYAAEIRKIEAAIQRAVTKEERRRKLSAKETLAQAYVDGSYAKYLLGP